MISTTIIESGIDIPNANTMIIDQADHFGLAQLHQLRGRIGRSDKKAYAYFIIPRYRKLTPIAQKRLHALQTYADMGSGFNIASIDMELRGAGDILGGEQSGHIESVGLELYMELLKEAVAELRGETKMIQPDVEIQTPFPSFIPHNYIAQSSERLRYYKQLSNSSTLEKLNDLFDNLNDIFGPIPQEMKNLYIILQCRIMLKASGIRSLKLAGRIISIEFDQNILNNNDILRNKIVNIFISRPKIYKFSPDYKVTYRAKEKVDINALFKVVEDISYQIKKN